MFVLVSYDIPNDKRRYRVMKAVQDYGTRVQYSVFECELKPAQLARLKSRLKGLILPAEDDVRFYTLCKECIKHLVHLGHPRPAMRWESSFYEI